jgi:hypothetical protein
MSSVLIEGLFNDNVSSSTSSITEEFVRNGSERMRKEAVAVRRSLQPKQTTEYLGKGNRPADRGLQPGPPK